MIRFEWKTGVPLGSPFFISVSHRRYVVLRGASLVVAYCTHAVLSGNAVSNIENSELDELVVTNTIPLSEDAAACSKIRQLSIAELIAESIRRVHEEESIGSLFMD